MNTDKGALTYFDACRLLIKRTWKHLVVETMVSVLILSLASFVVPEEYIVYLALAISLVIGLYNLLVAVYYQRMIYFQETLEGREKQHKKNTNEKGKRSKRLRDVLLFTIIYLFGIVYGVAMEKVKKLAAESSSNAQIAIAGCFGVKVLNFLLRNVFMRISIHPLIILSCYAISSIMFGTQMRLLFNYLSHNEDSIPTSVVLLLGAVEIIVRMTLISKTVLIINAHLKRIKDAPKDSLTMKKFETWKKKRYSVVEAENYSEMLSEYVAIFFSMFIYIAAERKLTVEMIYLMLYQTAMELIVDWLCLHVEKRMGMPIAAAIQSKKGFYFLLSLNGVISFTAVIVPMYLGTQNTFLNFSNN